MVQTPASHPMVRTATRCAHKCNICVHQVGGAAGPWGSHRRGGVRTRAHLFLNTCVWHFFLLLLHRRMGSCVNLLGCLAQSVPPAGWLKNDRNCCPAFWAGKPEFRVSAGPCSSAAPLPPRPSSGPWWFAGSRRVSVACSRAPLWPPALPLVSSLCVSVLTLGCLLVGRLSQWWRALPYPVWAHLNWLHSFSFLLG